MAAFSVSAVATTSFALVSFVGLTLLSTLSFSYESAIVLVPGSPMVAMISPYEIYEILVPVDSLIVEEQYEIRPSWNGGHSADIIIKRKKLDFESSLDELY